MGQEPVISRGSQTFFNAQICHTAVTVLKSWTASHTLDLCPMRSVISPSCRTSPTSVSGSPFSSTLHMNGGTIKGESSTLGETVPELTLACSALKSLERLGPSQWASVQFLRWFSLWTVRMDGRAAKPFYEDLQGRAALKLNGLRRFLITFHGCSEFVFVVWLSPMLPVWEFPTANCKKLHSIIWHGQMTVEYDVGKPFLQIFTNYNFF